jgi:hypothetical protein
MALPVVPLVTSAAAVATAAVKAAPEFRTTLNGAERTQLALGALNATTDLARIAAPVVQTYFVEAASVEKTRLACQVSMRRIDATAADQATLMALHAVGIARVQSDDAVLAALQSASAASARFQANLAKL